MRIKKINSDVAEGDLTPMIDMTFQLIAFFMVLINFTEADQDTRVTLPHSVLAKPAETPFEFPIYLNVVSEGGVVFAGEEVSDEKLRQRLLREREVLRLSDREAKDATIVLRADAHASTGRVQEIIKLCQDEHYEKFALRAKEDVN